MKTNRALTNGLLLAALIPLLTGCAAFRAKTTEVDPTTTRHLGAGYDYSDMRKITESVASEIIASPFLADQAEAPVMPPRPRRKPRRRWAANSARSIC